MSGPVGASQWMYSSGEFDIGQSLKFNDDESQYLSWTPASAGNRKTWTFSAWVKRGNLGADNYLLSVPDSTGHASFRFNSSTDTLEWSAFTAGYGVATTSATFRDVSAWYHIVLSYDTTNATSTDRIKIYVNGTLQSTSSYTAPTLNIDTPVSNTVTQYIGKSASASQYLDGYLADVHFIDGQALDPTSFGETVDGYWRPIAYDGSYGSNGFHLEFDSNVNDTSGNSNDWTANNLASYDYMLDTPTNNFATLNPLNKWSGTTLSEGNTKVVHGSSSNGWVATGTTMGLPNSGKWYAETRVGTISGGDYVAIGIVEGNPSFVAQSGDSARFAWGRLYFGHNGIVGPSNTAVQSTSVAPTYTTGDIISIAWDGDNGDVWWAKNGVWTNSGNPATGTNPAYTGLSGDFQISLEGYTTSQAVFNAGQDSTFAGATTAGGNTDANGIGDFKYSVPSGYLALCTSNLPTPTIVDGSQHFNTVLYTGNDTNPHAITGVGFQPDFVWLKSRQFTTVGHSLQDILRPIGGNNSYPRLVSNSTAAESANSGLLSFDSDGFTLNTDAFTNSSTTGGSMVAWNWKAGGTAVSNTDGSITSQVSANTDMGFSIVSYTGTGSAATVGHSLGVAPSMVIVKNRSAADGWLVWHEGLSSGTSYLLLNSTNAQASNSAYFNGSPTSSVFNIGTSTNTNGSGNDLIAYCFANSDIIKAGSYTGNGSSDGPMVVTNGRPAWVLIKRADGGTHHWRLFDAVRSTFNQVDDYLTPSSTIAEGVGKDIDFLSNGFKIKTTDTDTNTSGGTHIYLCIMETPFKYATAR